MKRFLALSLAILLILAITPVAFAGISVTLDGEQISFDVPPQTIDGRTMVPLRAIFEALDAEIDWNADTQTVTATRDNTVVVMRVGNPVITVEGTDVRLDVPPLVINGRTLVPARAVAESFGVEVDWNADTQTVILTSQPIVSDRSADELILKTLELSKEANTYRMQGTMSVDMNVSVPGEAPVREQFDMSIDGVFQYDPLAMHMKMSIDLSGLLGELTPEELAELAALGIEVGTMTTEMVLVNGVSYTKMPGFDQWIIDDFSELDMMDELFQMTPQQYMEMTQQFGIANVLGADAVIGGVEFYTVRNNIDSATFRNIMEELLGDFNFDAMMPIDMGLSEDELAEAQMLIEAMFENMQASLVMVSYINKETVMTERMTVQMNINFSIPADVIPEGPMSIVMSIDGYFNISDYGVAIQLPDVSNAITLEQLMSMME